jgi:RNA polymerase-binding transcription factor
MTCHAARRRGEFERRLWDTRREVSRAIETTDAELTGLERDRPMDLLDDAARTLACTVLARLEERDHAALAEVRAAQARLAAGTYGICEACEGYIPMARLRALPTTRLCIKCETTVETAAR